MNSENDLQNKFETLPQALKDALTSVDLAQKLQTIGKNNFLHIDQVDELMEEIGLVMLGETRPENFGQKIAKRLELTNEKIGPLVKSVDDEIFKPIRSALVGLHDQKVLGLPVGAPLAQTKFQTPSSNVPPKAPGPDYDMSRDAILSAIENPPPAEVKVVYVPRRSPETADPKEYISRREELIKNLQNKKVPASLNAGEQAKKLSLIEEALLIAQKKAAETAIKNPVSPKLPLVESTTARTPQTQFLNAQSKPAGTEKTAYYPLSSIPVVQAEPQNAPEKTKRATALAGPATTPIVPRPILPSLKPADKLVSVIQIPHKVISLAGAPAPVEMPASSGVDPYREPV